MRRLLFDLETTLIPRPRWIPERIHCCVIRDVDTREQNIYTADGALGYMPLELGFERLARADMLIGHNISKFDIPVMEERAGFKLRPEVALFDTLSVSQQIYAANMFEHSLETRNAAAKGVRGDHARTQAMNDRLPAQLMKAHSLESWGYRLRCEKGKFAKSPDNFDHLSPEMIEYCEQDVEVNFLLFWYLLNSPAARGWGVNPGSVGITESRLSYLLGRQERNGVGLNVEAAASLAATLGGDQEELRAKLQAQVSPWLTRNGPDVVPKGNRESRKYKPGQLGYYNTADGCAYSKLKLVEFNPGSRVHVARILRKDYGWVPKKGAYGKDGTPTVDEETLSELTYPVIPDLLDYMMLKQRLGAVANGKQAWLKLEREGNLHGQVKATGCRTNRCSHSKPNFNVPKVKKNKAGEILYGAAGKYGYECRACFRPTRWKEGWVQVGADASGLELRALAHRLAFYDNGAFALELLEGDIHEEFRRAAGTFDREIQKNITYSLLYGAGDETIGLYVIEDWRAAFKRGDTKKPVPKLAFAAQLGKAVRSKLLNGIPALGMLIEACHMRFKPGWLTGLDGRIIGCKTEYGTVNDLLQSDGAIIMKHGKLLLAETLEDGGWEHGVEYAWMLDIHDEWQLECPPGLTDALGKMMCQAMTASGEKLGVRLPIEGEYKVGNNWAETH